MIFKDQIAAYAAAAPNNAIRNTEMFFQNYAIDRLQFEEFALRPFDEDSTTFYVSTVPRGFAGSKSDLDLILVANADDADNGISNMLFFNERRVGNKVIRRSDIAKSFELVAAALETPPDDRLAAIAEVNRTLPIKWADLERVVNGVSFAAGAPYAPYLGLVSRWTVHSSLVNYRQQLIFASLAALAGSPLATYGYMQNCLAGAMDAVMAACGQVLTNTKWTLPRWKLFRECATGNVVRQGIELVEALAQTFEMHRITTAPEPAEASTALSFYFDRLLCKFESKGEKRFVLTSKTQSHRFLPAATLLSQRGRNAVTDSKALEAILSVPCTAVESLDHVQAQLALDLLARDFIVLSGWRVVT